MLWKLMHLPLLLAVAMSPRPHADGRLPVKLHPSDRVIHRLLTVQEVSTLCHGHYGSRYRVTVRGYAVAWPTLGPAGSQGGEAELFNTAKVSPLPIGRDAFTFWGRREGLHLFQPRAVFRRYGRFPIDSWIIVHGLLHCRYLPWMEVDWWYRSTNVSRMLRDIAAAWVAVLEQPDNVHKRPSPGVWSPLEYACHVRDVFRLYDHRLQRMLLEDAPLFPNWD